MKTKSTKARGVAILLLLTLSLLTGCQSTVPPPGDSGVYSFRDDEGRTVHACQEPRRVAVLFSSLADMWCLAGGEVAVSVGESVERGILPEGTLLVDGGAGKTVDVEALVAATPDLVIGSADIAAHRALTPILEKANIPLALFRVDTLSDYERVMGVMCAITRRAELYESRVEAVRNEADGIIAAVPEDSVPPRILFVRVGSGYSATKAKRTDEHFVCAMLSELGAYNLADGTPVFADGLNIEAIIEMDPDYIFLSTMGNEEKARAYMDGLLVTAPWQTLTAVKANKYTYLSKELFQYKPCDDWATAYAVLYGHLYGATEK